LHKSADENSCGPAVETSWFLHQFLEGMDGSLDAMTCFTVGIAPLAPQMMLEEVKDQEGR